MSEKMSFAKVIDKITDDVCDAMAVINEAADEVFGSGRLTNV